jgi:hypothetical protein
MQRKSLNLLFVGAFVLALATACGGGSGIKTATGTKTVTKAMTTAAAPAKLPFKATFSAVNHRPVVGKNWPITVKVTDRSGKPIAATLQMNFLLGSLRVGQVDNGKIHHFTGRYHEIITFPAAAVGHQLTLQAVIKAKGKTKKVPWPISVVNG